MRRKEHHLAQEPCAEIAKDDGVVRLGVVRWCRNAGDVPEVGLPLVEPVHHRAAVKEQDSRPTLDEPPAVQELYAAFSH